MATNNDGHLLDSSGNVAVDFAWGPFPMQPNDERAATISNIGGTTGDYGWAATTQVASGRLDPALDNHAAAEAGWAGYPAYTPAAGNFMVTGASGNGTTVTYTAFNTLAVGDVVNITGLTIGAYNLSSATVATANRLGFTVTNSANPGVAVTAGVGRVEVTTAASGGDGAGLGYIVVPNVLGLTTALALDALKDAGYEANKITTASAATNAAKTVTAVVRAEGGLAVCTASGAGAAYAIGTKVTISNTGDATVNGTWTVVDKATNSFTVATTDTSALNLADITGAVVGVEGTIKTQSTAAGASSISTTATITVTPWAAAS